MKKKSFILIFILIIIDLFIKYLVTTNIALNSSIKVINSFFYLTNVLNDGAAWSILSGNRIILILVAITALVSLYYLYKTNNKLTKIDYILYSTLAAGIIGNLLDRILYGHVIDYLEFIIFKYHFPIFNFADSLIVISIIFISYKILKEGEPNVGNKNRPRKRQ